MINKNKIDQNQATNITAVLSGFGTVVTVADNVIKGDHLAAFGIAIIGVGVTFAQWLQGTPTSKAQLIAKVLRLNGSETNARLIQSAIDRILSSGLVPGITTTGTRPEPTRQPESSRLGVSQQVEAIGRRMQQQLNSPERQPTMQRPTAQRPMTRQQWDKWNQSDGEYPEVVQTGYDPNEIGPSTSSY